MRSTMAPITAACPFTTSCISGGVRASCPLYVDTIPLLEVGLTAQAGGAGVAESAEELATASAQTCAWTPIKKDRLHTHAPCTLMAPFLSDVDQLVLGDCTGGDWLHTCLPVTGRTIPSQTLTT